MCDSCTSTNTVHRVRMTVNDPGGKKKRDHHKELRGLAGLHREKREASARVITKNTHQSASFPLYNLWFLICEVSITPNFLTASEEPYNLALPTSLVF